MAELKRFEVTFEHDTCEGTMCYTCQVVAVDEDSLRKWLVGGEPRVASDAFWEMCPDAPRTTSPAIFFNEGTLTITEAPLPVTFPIIFRTQAEPKP
jgi:hypothetical protein